MKCFSGNVTWSSPRTERPADTWWDDVCWTPGPADTEIYRCALWLSTCIKLLLLLWGRGRGRGLSFHTDPVMLVYQTVGKRVQNEPKQTNLLCEQGDVTHIAALLTSTCSSRRWLVLTLCDLTSYTASEWVLVPAFSVFGFLDSFQIIRFLFRCSSLYYFVFELLGFFLLSTHSDF